MPVFNVDGVALIEETWKTDHKFLDDRKSMNPSYGECSKSGGSKIDYGVDLNRNFAIDFGQVDDILQYS